MITSMYLSPLQVSRHANGGTSRLRAQRAGDSSTPMKVTASKRVESSMSRHWPSVRTAVFAVCQDTARFAAITAMVS